MGSVQGVVLRMNPERFGLNHSLQVD